METNGDGYFKTVKLPIARIEVDVGGDEPLSIDLVTAKDFFDRVRGYDPLENVTKPVPFHVWEPEARAWIKEHSGHVLTASQLWQLATELDYAYADWQKKTDAGYKSRYPSDLFHSQQTDPPEESLPSFFRPSKPRENSETDKPPETSPTSECMTSCTPPPETPTRPTEPEPSS